MRKDAAITRARCMELAAEGKGPKQIAEALGVTGRCVRGHLNTRGAAAELRTLQDERLKAITRWALAAADIAFEALETAPQRGRVETARVMAAKPLLEHGQKLIEANDLAARIEALEGRLANAPKEREATWPRRTA